MNDSVAINPSTGQILVLSQDGQWTEPPLARNPQTGRELYHNGRDWVAVPPRPEPPRDPSMGRAFGLGVRDVIQGAMALPNMIMEAPQALAQAGARALGIDSGRPQPTYSEVTAQALDAVGLPRPEVPSEARQSAIQQNVAAILPTVGAGALMQGARAGAGVAPELAQLLGSNIPSQIAGAAGAGAAGNAAAESGYGAPAQFGAALLGGVGGAGAVQGLATGGRAAAALVQPFSEAGRRNITADILLRSSSAPEALPGRIAEGVADTAARLPEAPVTTAQAARDPGLMLLEQGMRSQVTPNTPVGQSPAIAIRELEARRNAGRVQAIEGMRDGGNPEQRGAAIRQGLEGSEAAMGERVDFAFNIARDRNAQRYATTPIMEETRTATRFFDPAQGGGGIPTELQGVIDDIAQMPSMTLTQAQNLRSRLGEIAGKASSSGDNRLASAAGRISERIESTINDPRWMAAVDLRRQMGEAVGRNAEGVNAAGSILRTDRFGNPMMPDAAVAARALESPAAVRQVMEAGYKALDDARRARLPIEQIEQLSQQVKGMRGALRGQFMEDLFKASATASDIADNAGNVTRALSPAQFRRFFDQNSAVAREIFEPGQFLQLQRLARDFAETATTTRTAAAAGSPTAQNLSVANLIARTSNGLIDPGMPLAQALGGVGGVMRLVYSAPEAATRELLTRAMVDPQFAQMLLSRATPQSVRRATAYIEQNMMERLSQAGSEASERALIRTGTAEETRPEQPQRRLR